MFFSTYKIICIFIFQVYLKYLVRIPSNFFSILTSKFHLHLMKHFILSVICIYSMLLPAELLATHIVGGELNYSHIEGQEYEIDLRLFVDCYNGVISFDQEISIGIFYGISGDLFQDIRIDFDSLTIDTLPPPTSSADCLIFPGNICTSTGAYKATVQLPPSQEGYILAFQRCCRNETIGNIYNPDLTGITLEAYISPLATIEKNSNPKFINWPSPFICAESSINFPHDAYDEDGDSLVYKLCTPLNTPDSAFIFLPPNPPPYEEVEWINPPYSIDNMLNAFPGTALNIDSQTGLLDGIPNTVGQFVVGVCVEEYRNGILMGFTRRDFQYNVGICQPTTANFTYPTCAGLEIDFTNLSVSANTFLWNFDLINNPDSTSTVPSPSYTYPSTGEYLVQLIAEPYTLCADTMAVWINVQEAGMFPEIDIQELNCDAPKIIQFLAIPNDSISQALEYTWTFDNGDTGSNNLYIQLINSFPSTLSVQLEILGSDNCIYKVDTSYIIEEPVEASFEEVVACITTPVIFNNTSNGASNYLWNFDLINQPDLISTNFNTFHEYEEPGTYLVRLIADPNTNCSDTLIKEITIDPPSLSLDIEYSIVDCSDSLTLDLTAVYSTVNGLPPDFLIWQLPGLPSSFNDNIQIQIPLTQDEYPIQLLAYGVDMCYYFADTIIQNIQIPPLPQEGPYYLCPDDTLSINLEQEEGLTYSWSPDENTATDSSALFIFPVEETDYTLELSNIYGCNAEALLSVIPLGNIPETVNIEQICGSKEIILYPEVNHPHQIMWDFGDGSPVESFEENETISHLFPDYGNYTVEYWFIGQESCQDTGQIQINLIDETMDVNTMWGLTGCDDSLTIELSLNFDSNSFSADSILWTWDNGNSSNESSIQIETLDNISFNVEIFYNSTCSILISETTDFSLPYQFLTDSLTLCMGDSLLITLPDSTDLNYTWLANNNTDLVTGAQLAILPEISDLFILQSSLEVDSFNCLFSDSIYLQLIELPVNEILSPQIQNCQDSIYFLASNSQADNEQQWYFDNTFLGSEDSIVLTNSDIEGLLTLNSISPEGCIFEDSLYYSPSLIWTFADSILRPCFEDSITLSIDLDEGIELNWLSITAPIFSPSTTYTFAYAVEETYSFVLNDQYSCEDTVTIMIAGYPAPEELFITASSDTVVNGNEIILNSSLIGPYEYSWIYNNFVYSQELYSTTVYPTESTTYYLELTDSNLCFQRAGIDITVLDPSCQLPYVYIPNTFTPNNDQKNDCFRVEGNFLDELVMKIYNRWGELIFESTEQEDCWDGRYKNSDLDSDVYVYEVWYRCINGEEKYQKGNITLIR